MRMFEAHRLAPLVGRRLGATLAVLIATGVAAPAMAQVNIFGGGGQQSSPSQQQQAQMSLRLQQIEQQLRQMTGQVEQLTFQNQQLQDQMRRMQQDYEFRLQELETNKKPQKRSDAAPAAPANQASTNQPSTHAGPADAPPVDSADAPSLDDLPRAAPNQQAALGDVDAAALGAPPAVLGQIPATDDPIGASLSGTGPLDLRPGGKAAAPGQDLPPGVDPKLAALPAVPNPRAEYDAAYGYVLSGEWQLAQASFQRFIENHPTDRRVGSAMYWLGEAFSARRQFREAADAYLKSYTQYPDDPKAPDSLFKLGVTLGNLGERQAACATYGELLDKYPRASKALRDRAVGERQRARCA
jgi:tol-pal system protein YbgF